MLKLLLKRPIAVLTVFIVLVAVSGLLLLDLPLDMFPDSNAPVLSITTVYPGAGPEEVEEEVTRLVESVVSGMDGMESMTSRSSENVSFVLLEYSFGIDLNMKEAAVRSRLEQLAALLPEESRSPMIQRLDPAAFPILTLTVSGDRSERDMVRLVDKRIVPSLEGIPGVASATLLGDRDSIVRVDVDQSSLEAYSLTLGALSQILSAQNFQLGAGSLMDSGLDILIRTDGRFRSLDELAETVVMSAPGAPGRPAATVLLQDLADISMSYEDMDELVLIDGEPGLIIEIRKGAEGNSVKVADAVKAELEGLNASLPAGVVLGILTDSTEDIRANISQVGSAALWGILFAVLVVLLFLRQMRSTLIVSISIPVSLIMTMASLALTGRTLNLLTLIGLSLGVGLIVDSSIVIIENIYRYRRRGAPMLVSAARGAGEMMNPIVASTLTTIAVFLPIMIYRRNLGFVASFFGELAFIIIVALISSLAVAAFLVPVLSSHFLPIHTRKEKPIKNRTLRGLDEGVERMLLFMEKLLERLLSWAIARKGATVFILAVILAATVWAAGRLNISMIPRLPEPSMILEAEFPAGADVTVVKNTMELLQDRIVRETHQVDLIILRAQKAAGSLEITLQEELNNYQDTPRLKRELSRFFDDFPGVHFSFRQNDPTAMVFDAVGVDIRISGSDWDAMLVMAEDAVEILSGIEVLSEVENEAEVGLPQLVVAFDRTALYEQGLSSAAVAAELRALTAGVSATEFLHDGTTYDVYLRLEEQDRSTVEDLRRMFITSPAGNRVMVTQIADIRSSRAPVAINREDQVRTVHVVGTPAEGVSVAEATRAVQNALEEELPASPGADWLVEGELTEFQDMARPMIMVMLMATFLVVAVMVAQFESFKDPAIIAMALPFMGVGIVFLFLATGTTLSVISLMGVVLLLGIVVNNGIVLVDYTRLMRKRGMSLDRACIESGRSRLRPVLMTSLTTILALVPMAFFPGEGGELMQPMGVAVVGGLSTSMLGTLVLVPLLYSFVHRKEAPDYESRRTSRQRLRRWETVGNQGEDL